MHVLLLIVGVASASLNFTVAPDPSKTFGVWEGWGTSLCWWANTMGDRADLAELIFSTKDAVNVKTRSGKSTLPGLGLNIARYNAGGSSEVPDEKGEKMSLSRNMRAGGEVMGFWVDWKSNDSSTKSWDWTNDANQVSMLQKARDAAGDGFIAELFSNSRKGIRLYCL
jgi:galactan endo-1,6-beta-galactosidase